jgi:hypothetical protein
MPVAQRMTDRERAQIAEARVAELQDEVAAWRDYFKDDRATLRRDRLVDALRKAYPKFSGRDSVSMLLHMAGRPGRVLSKNLLLDAICDDLNETPDIKIVDVYVCKLRPALNALLNQEPCIVTHWGHGYSVPEDVAAALLAIVAEPAARVPA